MSMNKTHITLSLAIAFASGMTAQTLEANPNTKKMEAAIYQYFRGVQSLDTQTYVKAFASDGTLEDPAGTAPVRGRAAIGTVYSGVPQLFGKLTPRVKEIYVGVGNSTEATVSWTLTGYTKQGKQVVVHGIVIFKFKDYLSG